MSIDKYFTEQMMNGTRLTLELVKASEEYMLTHPEVESTKAQLEYLNSKLGTYELSYIGINEEGETKSIPIFSDEFEIFAPVLSFIKYKNGLPVFLITNFTNFRIIFNSLRAL